MLSKLKAIVPNNLLALAKKTPKIPVAIVCANHSSTIESAKEACDMSLIDPIFIGQKDTILEEAENQVWDISSYQVINTNDNQDILSCFPWRTVLPLSLLLAHIEVQMS